MGNDDGQNFFPFKERFNVSCNAQMEGIVFRSLFGRFGFMVGLRCAKFCSLIVGRLN